MIEPAHPTEDQIRRRIEYHESGAWWYGSHGQTAWSKERADYWRAKLPPAAQTQSIPGAQPGEFCPVCHSRDCVCDEVTRTARRDAARVAAELDEEFRHGKEFRETLANLDGGGKEPSL